MLKKSVLSLALMAILGLAIASPALADTNKGNGKGNDDRGKDTRSIRMMVPLGTVGTITSINGSVFTLLGRYGTTTGTTTYSVNATNAIIVKNNATTTISALVVGDRADVVGAVTGTNIVATKVYVGMMKGWDDKKGTTTPMQGNGMPVVAGKVTAVSGSTVTITNSSNVAYTIDAANAKVMIKNKTGTISDVQVGDTVMAQGTVNGTNVVATTLLDGSNKNGNGKPGFFGGIGGFFKRLFGF